MIAPVSHRTTANELEWQKEPSIQFVKNSGVTTGDVICFDQLCLEKFTDICNNYAEFTSLLAHQR
jgi:hypothetical protein